MPRHARPGHRNLLRRDGVAVYDTAAGLLAHALHSQVDLHQAYGGVVPELASRDHVRRVVPLIEHVLARGRARARRPRRHRLHPGPGARRRAAGGRQRGQRARVRARQAGDRRPSPRRPPAVAAAGRPAARVPVRRAAGVRRPHPALRRRGRRRLPPARRHARRRRGRGVRQDREAAGPAVSRRPGAGRARRARRPRRGCACRGRCSTRGDLDFSFSGLKTAVLTLARAAGRRRPGRRCRCSARRTSRSSSRRRSSTCCARRRWRRSARPAMRGWSWPAAWARIARCATRLRAARRRARRRGVLSRPGVLHRQRRDDRAGRRAAARRVERPAAGAFTIRPRWPLTDLAEPVAAARDDR